MKKVISTPKAPAAIGPYSQAIETEGYLFTSGQIPINPATGEVEGTTIEEQAEQVMPVTRYRSFIPSVLVIFCKTAQYLVFQRFKILTNLLQLLNQFHSFIHHISIPFLDFFYYTGLHMFL